MQIPLTSAPLSDQLLAVTQQLKGPARKRASETVRELRQCGTLRQLRAYNEDPRKVVQAALQRQGSKIRQEQRRLRRLLVEERRLARDGLTLIAGVDEVGAGPLAGPVVAAAVILPQGTSIAGVDDSKKLSAARRQELDLLIRKRAIAFAIGSCTPEEIDHLNILQASREAMRRAVAGLEIRPEHVLVDARQIPAIEIPQTAIIGGDGKSQSIAAASIVAKVERDRLMQEMSQRYPGYGFESNSGYGTKQHLSGLERLGPCAIHRRSFAPVRDMV